MRLFRIIAALSCIALPAAPSRAADVELTFYHLRAPNDAHDVDQASGLHYGSLGEREGLWTVCDRNGGRSAGRIFFFSNETLSRARHRGFLIADDAFTPALPEEAWSDFVERHEKAGREALEELRRRIEAGAAGEEGPFLDFEAVTIAPSPAPPHAPRLFVADEEPSNFILEFALEGGGSTGTARLTAAYRYRERDDHRGEAGNDGLEGLAWTGRPGEFYWAEEGTKSHGQPPAPRLLFLDPLLGVAKLDDARVVVDEEATGSLSRAVHAHRDGEMQTLNGLCVLPDGRLAAVDRNGGWILRVDPKEHRAERWLNLYDLHGTNLREALAEFPGPRRMPYISIEGIAVDRDGHLWLVDDPAMPENFRVSCLVRLSGLDELKP